MSFPNEQTHIYSMHVAPFATFYNKFISGEPIGCRAHVTWIIRANHRADLQFFLDPVDVVRLQSAKYQSWSETDESAILAGLMDSLNLDCFSW